MSWIDALGSLAKLGSDLLGLKKDKKAENGAEQKQAADTVKGLPKPIPVPEEPEPKKGS